MAKRYEVAVIGGGPGGYPAGIRLGQLGKKAVVIEAGDVGGVCLNWGCIPSKAVIHAAELRAEISHAQDFGIGTGQAPVELPKLRDWKNGILTKLRGGIKGLLKANGTDLLEGRATFTAHDLEVALKGGARRRSSSSRR
ncbi:MAG: FAD-dependent oxidoreductase [Planctomycetota bacterium]